MPFDLSMKRSTEEFCRLPALRHRIGVHETGIRLIRYMDSCNDFFVQAAQKAFAEGGKK